MLPTATGEPGSPTVLGERYEILSPLGSGSMASVFKVRDRREGSLRAAKVLTPENAANPEILARFEDEFRILRTLHHPHLPEIYDYGWTDDGGRYLIMELVEGEPLDHYFRARPDDIWVILYQLCEALTFVHAKNLLHQDIKPSNILVTRTSAYGSEMPLVKLIDFGLTYRRDTGAAVQLVGTPAYVAPEVVQGGAPLTRAVDYYSLGATLYELLCGAPPFVGTVAEVLRAQVEREPVVEDEHLEWAELYPHVRALLTKDRRARLEAFEEFRRAIVSRLTGGIDELDKAYGLARIESLPMIGKDEVWKELMEWLGGVVQPELPITRVLLLRGASGVGKSLLIDRFQAECAMAGVILWRLGSKSEYRWLVQSEVVDDIGRFDTYARVWRQLKRVAHSRPIVFVVENIQDMGENEASFMHFAATQFELMSAQREGLRIFVLVVPQDTGQQPVSLDLLNVSDTKVPPLTADARALIVGTFRGELTDSADARVLVQVLSAAVDIQSVIRTLVHAAMTGTLVFSKWRWTVHGRILPSFGRVEDGGMDSTFLLTDGLPFDILAYVACHDRPLLPGTISELGGVRPEAVKQEISNLRRQELLQETVCDGNAAIDASATVRLAVLKALPAERKRVIHERFLKLFRDSGSGGRSSPEFCLSLAHHHDAIGQEREGSKLRIRIIRQAKKRRDFSAIEMLAESEVRRGVRGMLQRYYLKQWVESLWVRNHHARAFQVLERQLVDRNQRVPVGMLPYYLKGMSDAYGPRTALNQARRLRPKYGSSEPVLRFRIEKAFLLSTLGFNREAITELQKVLVRAGTLSTRDRYRALIYLAMNLLALGRLLRVAQVLKKVRATAFSQSCVDEHVLASTVHAQMLAMQGDPRNVLSLCASGIRSARDNGLDFRRNVLYRLAASAYHDLGDRRRARWYQEQATRLASALDMHEFEAMSWARLAHYEASAGLFGNALRYVDRALAVIDEGSTVSHRTQAETLRLWLNVWLKSPRLQTYMTAARRKVDGVANVNEKGRLYLVMAQGHADRGDISLAERLYTQARMCFRRSGFVDNHVSVLRGQIKLCLFHGDRRAAIRIYRQVCGLRHVVTSQNAMMECRIVALEFHLIARSSMQAIHRELVACESLCGDKVDTSLQLDALMLMFRARARHGDTRSAEALFGRITEAARNIAANVGVSYAAGLSERLELDSLTGEMCVVRRNARGRTTCRPRA